MHILINGKLRCNYLLYETIKMYFLARLQIVFKDSTISWIARIKLWLSKNLL